MFIPIAVHGGSRRLKSLIWRTHYEYAFCFTSAESSTFILPSLFKSCSHYQAHCFLGLQLHSHVLKTGSYYDSAIANSVISMYAKLSVPRCARKVFDEMSQRDTVSWKAIISCHSQNWFYVQSLYMFREMYESGFGPKHELITGVLSILQSLDRSIETRKNNTPYMV